MLDQLSKIDPAKLTPEMRARLEAVRDRLATANEKLALLDAEEEARRNDPARVMQEAERLAERRARDAVLRQAQRDGAAAYEAECERHGASRVALVNTVEGPIVLVSLGRDTLREMYKRVAELQNAGKSQDADEIAESYIDGAVAFPSPERLEELASRFPLLRGELLRVIRQLGMARAEAAGNAG